MHFFATWYYHTICIVFTYFASFTGYEYDIFEVISKLKVQGSKFGGKSFKKNSTPRSSWSSFFPSLLPYSTICPWNYCSLCCFHYLIVIYNLECPLDLFVGQVPMICVLQDPLVNDFKRALIKQQTTLNLYRILDHHIAFLPMWLFKFCLPLFQFIGPDVSNWINISDTDFRNSANFWFLEKSDLPMMDDPGNY